MTDRMEPTNRLRWHRKGTIVKAWNEVETIEMVTRLQQLWRVPDATFPQEEWRDVPVEDE